MKIQDIKQLIKAVEQSDINELEVVDDNFKLKLSKMNGYVPQIVSAPAQPVSVPADPVAPAPAQTTPAVETPAAKPEPEYGENIVEVHSPMVGTFYQAPAPDAAPYVEAGDQVKVGDTLCIIEAMKLMNEIQSEYTGKVVKVLVENSKPVEYDQVLFLIEKA